MPNGNKNWNPTKKWALANDGVISKTEIDSRQKDIIDILARVAQIEKAKGIAEDTQTDPFIKAYNTYILNCNKHRLTKEEAAKLTQIMDTALADMKANIENAKANNLSAEAIESLNNTYLRYTDMRQNLKSDCREYSIIEFVQVYEIFPHDGANSTHLDDVYPVKPGENKTVTEKITTAIPSVFFGEWEKPEIDLGSMTHGDTAIGEIEGDNTSPTVKITLFIAISYNADDRFGDQNYALNNFGTNARWSIKAKSKHIIVKVPKEKQLVWEEAQWNYTLGTDEKVNKKIKSISVTEFLKYYK